MAKNRKTVFTTVLTALCVAMIAVISQIAFPTPLGIPVTLQIFAVALCSYLLGVKLATVAVLVYVTMGAIGLPVFYGLRGGISAIIGEVTGGFIIGFLPLAVLCGLGTTVFWKRCGKWLCLLFGEIGLILCHVCGVCFYSALTGVDVFSAIAVTSLPFILKDALLIAAAFLIAPKISSAIARSGYKI
jgi:biotin transport system substrate-specific component